MSDFPTVPHRPVKAIWCYVAYLSSLATAIVCSILMYNIWAVRPLIFGLIVTCLATAVIYIFSIAHNNSSTYDPYWVIAPPFLIILLKSCGQADLIAWDNRQILLFALFLLWAARYHIFYAWTGWRSGLVHEDWRYEEMRAAPVPYWLNSLLGMHYFPTLLVYAAFIPAAFVFSNCNAPTALNSYDLVGALMALSAVSIQFFADRQLKTYRSTEAYARGETCRVGLWNFSRHPNYFGEVLFWLSTIPFAIGAQLVEEQMILVLFGPVLMAIFFRFSSYLMDVRSLKRRPGYHKTMQEVSAMLLWVSKK